MVSSRYNSYNMVDETGEKMWKTADGIEIPFSEVTHQHWSNIYWYHKFIFQMASEEIAERRHGYVSLADFLEEQIVKNQRIYNMALKEIIYRFDGDILDWKPKYDNEKKWFKKQQTRKILLEFVRNKVEKKEEDLG